MAISYSLTLLIDTQCPLCLRSAVFLDDLDKAGRLHFQSLYHPQTLPPTGTPESSAAALPQAQLKQAMHAIDEHGHWHVGPQALGQALIRLHAPWTWIGQALLIPRLQWLTQAVYAQVAANRYRWLPPLDDKMIALLRQRFPDLAVGPACDCH